MIRIKDLEFGVASAEISAILSTEDPELRWYINLQAVPRRIDEVEWRPRVYADGFTINTGKWTALDQAAIEIKDGSEEIGWDSGWLYVFEHLPTRLNRVSIRGRQAATLDLSWDAVCDVFAGDDYRKDLELSIRTPVQFSGVEVRGGSGVAQAARQLEGHLDIDELVVPTTTEKSAGGEQVVIFRPKPL